MTFTSDIAAPVDPEFIDIAGGGTATQSSRSRWSLPSGAQALVAEEAAPDFAIYTAESDAEPWWRLDLGAWYPVERIVIFNRRTVRFWKRAATIRVEASDDGAQWRTLHAGWVFFGADPENALTLPLAGRLPIRHIRISLDENERLHLSRVQVIVRAELMHHRRLMGSIGIGFSQLPRYTNGRRKRETYRVLPSSASADAPVSGLKLVRSGRFANNVLQMAHAMHHAEHAGLAYVQMLETPLFDFGVPAEADDSGAVARPRALPHDAVLPDQGVVIEGDFFDRARFSGPRASEAAEMAAITASARTYLRPYLRLPAAPPLAPEEVVVHIRSGDIFGTSPHPGYGQPPLSFFVRAIEIAREQGFDKVRVVAEDRVNPVVDALEAHLSSNGIPHVMQIAEDLSFDLATLLAARALVFGVGTFGHAICMLSAAVETVIEASGNRNYHHRFPELAIYSLRPASKTYTPFAEWTGSAEQCAEMLSYPAHGLRLDRNEAACARSEATVDGARGLLP